MLTITKPLVAIPTAWNGNIGSTNAIRWGRIICLFNQDKVLKDILRKTYLKEHLASALKVLNTSD